jgi:hypothetical protein
MTPSDSPQLLQTAPTMAKERGKEETGKSDISRGEIAGQLEDIKTNSTQGECELGFESTNQRKMRYHCISYP